MKDNDIFEKIFEAFVDAMKDMDEDDEMTTAEATTDEAATVTLDELYDDIPNEGRDLGIAVVSYDEGGLLAIDLTKNAPSSAYLLAATLLEAAADVYPGNSDPEKKLKDILCELADNAKGWGKYVGALKGGKR